MWKNLAFGLSILALAAVVACGSPKTEDIGDDDDSSPTPTPSGTATPTPTPVMRSFTINGDGNNAIPGIHDAQYVGVRLLDGNGTQVACGNDQLIDAANATNSYTYTFAASIMDGASYTMEVWYGNDGTPNQVYDNGTDHNWIFTGADMGYEALMNVSGDVTVTMGHPGNQTALTWGNGVGCN